MFVATRLDISDQITGHVTGLLVARKPDIIDEMSGRFAAENWICRDISSRVHCNNVRCFLQDISTICSCKQDMFNGMSRHLW